MQPRTLIAIGLSLLFFVSVANAETIEILPASPDSTQKITVRITGTRDDTCIPSDPYVSIEQRTIEIGFRIVDDVCLSGPTPYTREVTFGPIAPGVYTVLALFGGITPILGEAPLTVRDAGNPLRFFPHVARKTSFTPVVIDGVRNVFCEGGLPNCLDREVLFGDKPAQLERVIEGTTTVTAIAPPQDAEVVDVTIKYPDGSSVVARNAFRYFDPEALPDPGLFERILLPVTRSVRGAFGSDFRVSLAVFNDYRSLVPTWRPIGLATTIAPNVQSPLAPTQANGVLVFPLRTAAERLYFGSNVRDVSRVADTFGTEIRVVREADARIGQTELINIPSDPNFRLNLRLYGFDAKDGNLQVALYSPDGNVFLGDMTVRLTSPGPEEPAFATIADMRAAFPGLQETSGEFRIRVQGPFGYRFWPLLTITNNTTQQITTVTPQ